MNIYYVTALLGTVGLLTACTSTQTSQSSAAAITMPSSAEVGIMTKNIVPASSAAASNDGIVATGTTAKLAQNNKDRIICKRKPVTGSRFNKKICLSQKRWEELSTLGKKTASDLQNRGGRTNQDRAN